MKNSWRFENEKNGRWRLYRGGALIKRHFIGKQSEMFEVAFLRRWSSYKGGQFGDFYCKTGHNFETKYFLHITILGMCQGSRSMK